MADHGVKLELYYDATWNQAPALVGSPISYRRGRTSFGNETDPATGTARLDDTSGNYAPLSALGALYGKLGQNTPARITVDGVVQMTGEVSKWEPMPPVRGSSSTAIDVSGVLRRLGRGADPLLSAYTRAQLAAGPVDFWPMDEGSSAASAGNLITGGAALALRAGSTAVSFGDLDAALVPAGVIALPELNGGTLETTVRGTSTASWRMEFLLGFESGALAAYTSTALRSMLWTTGGGITTWWCEHGSDYMIIYGTSPYIAGLPFGATLRNSSEARFDDGLVHHVVLEVTQSTSTNMAYSAYIDGVLESSGSNTTGALIGQQQVGAPVGWTVNPDSKTEVLTGGGISVFSPKPSTAPSYSAVAGWVGETSADRMSRLGLEEGITVTIVGTAAESVAMGAQQPVSLLDQFDEIAVTDDASIFETRTALGLTMRTGASKLNQDPKLSISYIGQVKPPLYPVTGDEGLANDVTATNPNGSSRRVVQLTGIRNVQAPPTGTGRYKRSLSVNVADEDALADVAGWAVLQGTYDKAWYAAVTVDLNAAPGLISAVDTVDIGDVVELTELRVQETLLGFRGIVVGIAGKLPPKQREVTFYLIPDEAYRTGEMSITSGETDTFSGRLETDGATTTSAIAAGAATFSVTVPSGPLWTTAADDFPLDFVVGGQRVTVSGISGAASPQTFTVSTSSSGYKIGYAIAAGSQVTVYQPIILTR